MNLVERVGRLSARCIYISYMGMYFLPLVSVTLIECLPDTFMKHLNDMPSVPKKIQNPC